MKYESEPKPGCLSGLVYLFTVCKHRSPKCCSSCVGFFFSFYKTDPFWNKKRKKWKNVSNRAESGHIRSIRNTYTVLNRLRSSSSFELNFLLVVHFKGTHFLLYRRLLFSLFYSVDDWLTPLSLAAPPSFLPFPVLLRPRPRRHHRHSHYYYQGRTRIPQHNKSEKWL